MPDPPSHRNTYAEKLWEPYNTAHFSGIDGVGDGIRNITPYARNRLKRL